MFSKILVPLDGTDEAEAALTPAKAFTEKFGSEVVLLHVTPGYETAVGAVMAEPFGASGSVQAAVEAEQAAETSATAYLAAVCEEHGTKWQTFLGEGDSASAIADAAKKVNADLIIMATHGRRGLKRFFLGSATDDVIRKVNVPVLVMHREKGGDDDD